MLQNVVTIFNKYLAVFSYKLVLSILTGACSKIHELFVKENETACLLHLGVCVKFTEQGSTVIDIMLRPVFT